MGFQYISCNISKQTCMQFVSHCSRFCHLVSCHYKKSKQPKRTEEHELVAARESDNRRNVTESTDDKMDAIRAFPILLTPRGIALDMPRLAPTKPQSQTTCYGKKNRRWSKKINKKIKRGKKTKTLLKLKQGCLNKLTLLKKHNLS